MRTVARRMAVLLTFLSWPALAQVEHDFQSWGLFAAQGHALPSVRWYFELQPRLGTLSTRLDRVLVRPAVGLALNESFSLWFGYAWTPSFTPAFGDEHRPFQQLLAEHTLGPVTLVNRTRFEERLIASAGAPSLRLRHLLRAVWRFDGPAGFGLVASDELFFNLNDAPAGPPAGFDQNRAFMGVNYKVGALQVELGYLNNLVRRRGSAPVRMNHGVLIMLLYTVPL